MSGWAMTKPPSGVIMTPPIGPSAGTGPSTVLRNERGIPVVLLKRGLLSNSLSSLVGQSWIQWPVGGGGQSKEANGGSDDAQQGTDRDGHRAPTTLAAAVADVARWQRLVDELGDEIPTLMAPIAATAATHAAASAHAAPAAADGIDGRRASRHKKPRDTRIVSSTRRSLAERSSRDARRHRLLRLLPLVRLSLEHGRDLGSLVLATDGRSSLDLRVQGLHWTMKWQRGHQQPSHACRLGPLQV
jgi:hypothetical protein